MKFFTIFLVIAVAVGCQAYNGRWQDASSEERSAEQQRSWQSNVDEQVTEILNAAQHGGASIHTNEEWNNFANENPEAAPYQRKIVQRLQRSESLANKPIIQKSILKLALEKLNMYKSQSSPQNAINHSLLGPFTGQMMQLISAIENVNRNHPGQ